MSFTYWAVPDFLQDPDAMRHRALISKWEDVTTPQDGQTYKRVSPVDVPEVWDTISAQMGRPVTAIGAAFRLNYDEELPNAAIHSDGEGWGRYAMVLPLDRHPPRGNGTAFWRHLPTGKERLSASDYEAVFEMEKHWNDPSKFEQVGFVQAEYNRALFYNSALLHSRWPFKAYGTTPETGRLTLVAFFT